jgi:hypothetical protein
MTPAAATDPRLDQPAIVRSTTMPYRFEREARTPYSEVFIIEDDEGNEVGRVDIHFTPSVTYATLCVQDGMDEEAVQDLISQIDERLVMTTDPYREDFVVTVWKGREAGVYSDEDEETEEELDFEDTDNGHRG